MRFYVYLLLDESQRPFYAGIHESEDRNCSGLSAIDLDFHAIRQNMTEGEREKLDAIERKLSDDRVTVPDNFRVIARDLKTKNQAVVIRKALITSWGTQEGIIAPACEWDNKHFRCHQSLFYNHSHIEEFDPHSDAQGRVLPDRGRGHFIYSLFNPANNRVFYVGRGQGSRIWDHFRSAQHLNQETIEKRKREKLETINRILEEGYQPCMMVKILARVDNEQEASILESFYIKFIFGVWELENATGGKNQNLLRAKDDMQQRDGFEVLREKRNRGGRFISNDLMLGQNFDKQLEAVVSGLNTLITESGHKALCFDVPRIRASGELATQAVVDVPLGQIVLKIYIRSAATRGVYCATHPKGGTERSRKTSYATWEQIFSAHGLDRPTRAHGFRGDFHCNPVFWQDRFNPTTVINAAVNRAFLLYGLITSDMTGQEQLSDQVSQAWPATMIPVKAYETVWDRNSLLVNTESRIVRPLVLFFTDRRDKKLERAISEGYVRRIKKFAEKVAKGVVREPPVCPYIIYVDETGKWIRHPFHEELKEFAQLGYPCADPLGDIHSAPYDGLIVINKSGRCWQTIDKFIENSSLPTTQNPETVKLRG